MAKVSKLVVDVQSGTTRNVYATWTWSKKNTKEYSIEWYYDTGNGVWFVGTKTTTTEKQSTYNAPENATKVKFKVKPVAKTHKVKGKNTAYWTADLDSKEYSFSSNPPVTPSVPTVKIKNYDLTVEVDDANPTNDIIQFYIVRNDNDPVVYVNIHKNMDRAAYSCKVAAGSTYRACCRGVKDGEYSEWSDYSAWVETIPDGISGSPTCKALTATSVRVEWNAVGNAESYNVEYASDRDWFDSSNQTQNVSVKNNRADVTGLESGKTWFFRVQAVNAQGESGWSDIVSVTIGKTPSAPTTWSSTTTAVVGEDVTLYWVHNSQDNSSQTYAELQMTVGGSTTTKKIQNSTEEDEKDKTSFYPLDTSKYSEGTKILWRVRTKGIMDEYSEWSIQREISVHAQPTLSMTITDGNGRADNFIESFPINMVLSAGPNTQKAIGYSVVIIANEAYQIVDYTGEEKWVNKNEEIYSKVFDSTDNPLRLTLEPGDVNLGSGVSYTFKSVVSMDSGLTAECSVIFTVDLEDDQFEPDAEITIDPDSVSAYIRPYCEDENGELLADVLLSVYRMEFDGELTELATELENSSIHITDPHPSLNYARYRIVGISKKTGKVCFSDVFTPVYESAIIIQWDEVWSSFNSELETEELPWTGSLLRLPYNIDISEKTSRDVALVEYVGRKHPVEYFGTQVGESSTWNVEIPATDDETIYALRRLAVWMGSVYVREPSGVGHWANVNVSFNRKHCALTIPVTLEITRVEGGV